MKIYVASSWRNQYHQKVVLFLRDAGHEVYDFKRPDNDNTGFHWSQIDPDWESWTVEQYQEGLKHPLAKAHFDKDFNAMEWADCCVIVMPCGRSAHTEAGLMKGKGKPVFIYIPESQEPELMYKVYDGVFDNLGKISLAMSFLQNSGIPQDGLSIITKERKRQIEEEGWSLEYDEQYTREQLATAAACYATPGPFRMFDPRRDNIPLLWPWLSNWWKPSENDRIKELAKAGALIAAEIDRLLKLEETD